MRLFEENEIEAMAAVLRQDGVLAVPTDTVYGLCARTSSLQAMEKLVTIKHRPKNKAFPLMCSTIEQADSIAYINQQSKNIISFFMPGPLTVILRKRKKLPSWVSEGMETVAIRLATSESLKQLIDALQEPVFMTSANRSSEKECETIEEIEEECRGIQGILKGAPSFKQASTIVDLTKPQPVVLRKGPILEKDLLQQWNVHVIRSGLRQFKK